MSKEKIQAWINENYRLLDDMKSLAWADRESWDELKHEIEILEAVLNG